MEEDLRKYTLQEALEILANSDDEEWFMRKAVAKYSKTSPKTLKKLAKDKDEEVRAAVASNTVTPKETLEELADSEEYSVCVEVAWNPSASEKLLDEMAKTFEYNWEALFRGIIRNPSTRLDTLEYLAIEGRTTDIRREAEEELEKRKEK